MTVPATSRRAGPYSGNGSTTSFSFSFKTFAAGDLLVTKTDAAGVETALVLNSDYSVTLNGDQDASPGGSITYPISGTPLATGQKLTIVGDLDYEQTTDLLGGGAFNARVIEDTFDRTVIQIQQLEERADRAMVLPVSVSGVSATLPAPSANKLIGWDANANSLTNIDQAGLFTGIVYSDWVADRYTGDGTATTFALSRAPGALANIDVSIAGVTQVATTDYSVVGNLLAFTAAPPNGATIFVRYGSSAVQTSLSYTTEQKTATAGQTVVTLTSASYVPGANNLQVHVNGLRVVPGVDYLETSSTSVTFTTGLTLGDELLFVAGRTISDAVGAESVGYLPTGTGAVARTAQLKLRETISPADFGAVGDGVTDDTAALQAFMNAVVAGRSGVMPSGTFLIKSPITITIGSRFSLLGSGAPTILVDPAFAGGTSALRIIGTGTDTDWTIGGFTVTAAALGASGTATAGITIGDAATVAINIRGYRFSRIEQVHVANFATCWTVVHARMIEFVGCSAWNSSVSATNQTNLLITQNGAFTGDLRFVNCQFVTKTVSGNKNISITSPVGPYSNVTGFGNVAGIKFIGCDVYAGDKSIYLYATAAAYISDIWFTGGCQVDQETTNAIWIEANNASTNIEDIHLDHVYVDKSTGTQVTLTSTGTGGNVQSVWISHCSIWRGAGRAIELTGTAVRGIHILSNEIIDCAGAEAIRVNGATATRVRGNRHRTGLLAQQPGHLVKFESGSTDLEATGNSGTVTTAVINDLSGSITSKTIDLNPGFNPRPQASITVTASPFTYTNYSGAPQFVSIGGGTVSGITVDGLAITPTTNLFVPVPHGKALVVTYSVAPTLFAVGY